MTTKCNPEDIQAQNSEALSDEELETLSGGLLASRGHNEIVNVPDRTRGVNLG